ncbi:unnamed protein product [Schistocephalus solidus]|uniref:Transmembrane protein n=1 Tax=Schistocephalus solidus TaxID=70667 RepID=A0A183SCQ5_SCHSO|nr:unnamed protein product [Schistocephalus solidus]
MSASIISFSGSTVMIIIRMVSSTPRDSLFLFFPIVSVIFVMVLTVSSSAFILTAVLVGNIEVDRASLLGYERWMEVNFSCIKTVSTPLRSKPIGLVHGRKMGTINIRVYTQCRQWMRGANLESIGHIRKERPWDGDSDGIVGIVVGIEIAFLIY